MTFGNRLKQLLENQNLTQVEFSKKTGVNRSTIANTLTKDNAPGGEFIALVVKAFPNINARWFVTGEGDMWLEEDLGEVAFYKKQMNEYKELNKHANLIIEVWQKNTKM